MKRPCDCDRFEKGQPWAHPQCRLCWLYHHDERYKRLWSEPHEPTIGEKIGAVSKAAQKWRDAGFPLRTTEELGECFDICRGCEHYQPHPTAVCGKCGCFLSAKARMATEACPLGKWPTRSQTEPSPRPTE